MKAIVHSSRAPGCFMPEQLDPVDVSRSIPAGTTLLGRLVGLGGGPLAAAGAVVLLTGLLMEYAAWTVGLGGALLARLGRRGPLAAVVPPMPDLSSDPFAGGSAAL